MNKDPRPERSRTAVQRHLLRFKDRELRAEAAAAADSIAFSGHGVVYDAWTEIYDPWFGSYMERIAPGAAHGHLEDDVRLLINHDANLLLARTTNGTMRLSEDTIGVVAEADMAPTTYARDLAILLQRGDITQMSFSFIPGDEEWTMRPDGVWLRTITSFEALYDMSIVTYPAYEETDAGLRAAGRQSVSSARAGRRNSSADEATIRSAVEGIREHADSLEGILDSSETASADEEKGAKAPAETALRAAMALQARNHQLMAARLGLGR